MITYEQIKAVNEEIELTDIEHKGKVKKYADVSQRIMAFRKLYPDGFITTEIVSHENGVIIMTATAGYYNDGESVILGTGTAYEKENGSFINKTSYIENCETSAVGRALAMLGIGIDTGIASATEVQNAITNQIADEKITEVMVKALEKRCLADKVAVDTICKLYKVNGLNELTNKMHNNINQNWEKIKEVKQ